MDFQPVPWAPPANPGLRGRYDANRRMAGAELWDAGGEGPEDIVVDNEGRVYSGLLDGCIVRFGPDGSGPEVIARTGGRPLGLELATWGGLIVCDACGSPNAPRPISNPATSTRSIGRPSARCSPPRGTGPGPRASA